MAAPEQELAMFPLESVVLPHQDLPLRIFEPRYVALVRHCVDSGEPFGVVLISRGREVGGGDTRSDVGVLSRITECIDHGLDRYSLRCKAGERIRVREWLPDDPYPRAIVRLWPDEPGAAMTQDQLCEVEDRAMALFERIAEARGVALPGRDVLLDDRDERPGVLFADHDLMGIPHRLVLSERGLAASSAEYKGRRDEKAQDLPLKDAAAFIEGRLKTP